MLKQFGFIVSLIAGLISIYVFIIDPPTWPPAPPPGAPSVDVPKQPDKRDAFVYIDDLPQTQILRDNKLISISKTAEKSFIDNWGKEYNHGLYGYLYNDLQFIEIILNNNYSRFDGYVAVSQNSKNRNENTSQVKIYTDNNNPYIIDIKVPEEPKFFSIDLRDKKTLRIETLGYDMWIGVVDAKLYKSN